MSDRALIGVSSCRSCGASIEWALTTNGARIPLDVDERPDGNLILDDDHRAHTTPPGTGNRVSHFATCPNASEHRHPSRRGRS